MSNDEAANNRSVAERAQEELNAIGVTTGDNGSVQLTEYELKDGGKAVYVVIDRDMNPAIRDLVRTTLNDAGIPSQIARYGLEDRGPVGAAWTDKEEARDDNIEHYLH